MIFGGRCWLMVCCCWFCLMLMIVCLVLMLFFVRFGGWLRRLCLFGYICLMVFDVLVWGWLRCLSGVVVLFSVVMSWFGVMVGGCGGWSSVWLMVVWC